MQEEIKWQAYEYVYKPKSNQWFLAVWILAVALAFVSYLFSNLLFGILVLLVAFLGSVLASRKPNLIDFSLSEKGIQTENFFVYFKDIQSFFVGEEKLFLKHKLKMKTLIIIPLSGKVDKEKLREYLLDGLEEEELSESVLHFFLDKIGF